MKPCALCFYLLSPIFTVLVHSLCSHYQQTHTVSTYNNVVEHFTTKNSVSHFTKELVDFCRHHLGFLQPVNEVPVIGQRRSEAVVETPFMALVAITQSQGQHALKHNLLSGLFYSEWDHNIIINNANNGLLKKTLN